MPIKFNCPLCATTLIVPDAIVGKTGKCKGCGGKIVVPANSEAARATPPADAQPTNPARTRAPESPSTAPRSSTRATGPATPPPRTRPPNPAPTHVQTTAPASVPLDSYGAIFDRVAAATGGADDGVMNAEVVDEGPTSWESTPFAAPQRSPGSPFQAAPAGQYMANPIRAAKRQRSKHFQEFWALGLVSLLGMLFSAAMFSLEPERPPTPLDLAALEAGTEPSDKYVELGPHIACCYAGVCIMRKKDEKKDDPPIETFCYPVISMTHPAAEELLALAREHGSFAELPEGVFIPALEDVSAIVSTDQFRRASNVPVVPVRIERLPGTQSMSIPQSRLLEESCELPRGGLRDAIGIKANDKPAFRSVWSLGGGVVFAIGSLVLLGWSLTSGYRWIAKPKGGS